MSMIGNQVISTDFPKDTFSGNGSTTAFTMQIAPASVNAVIVVVSGITQDPSTYTISGTTLTFSAAPPTGTSNISVRHLGVAGIPNTPSAGSVVATSIADGVITAAKFASGQTPTFNGITFPATQSASADANTLDDYEEGTWTPTFGANSGSCTYSAQTGSYTKIGRQVTVTFYLAINVSSSFVSDGNINGLPFTGANTNYAGASLSAFNGGTFNSYSNILLLIASGTIAQLRGTNSATQAPATVFGSLGLASGTFIAGTITYFSA